MSKRVRMVLIIGKTYRKAWNALEKGGLTSYANSTSLEGIEELRVMDPIFQPKISGIVINDYFNCKGD